MTNAGRGRNERVSSFGLRATAGCRQARVFLAVLWGLLVGGPAVFGADLFPDKHLAEAIAETLKKNSPAEVKAEDLKNVFILKARGRKIADLSGLENCGHLQLIDLADNDIQDVAPLAKLDDLQSIDLSHNKIGDLAPLAGLETLQYLQLEGNHVKALKPLAGLKKLSALYLAGNEIESVAPLSGLEKLSTLDLNDNRVSDIGPLKTLTWLSLLGLKNNRVKDLSPLKEMTELRYTFLQGNEITDLAPLVEMARKDAEGEQRFAPYWRLYLADNPMSEAARKEQIPALEKIGVRVMAE